MNAAQPGRRRWVTVAVVVAFVVALAAVGAGALRHEQPSAADAANPTKHSGAALTVSTVRPTAMLWPEGVSANGAIAPWQEASVGAEVAGIRLVEVAADVGDQVQAGQLLARFDPAPMLAAYAQQKAALAEAQAKLAEARANSARAEQLRHTQAISEQDLIRAVTTMQAAQAQVELATARLTSQTISLENTRVVAPDDGVISSRSAMLGAVAAPGMELFRLVRQNRLEWRAELTGADIAVVEIGDRAEVTLPDRSVLSGTVRQVSPILDTGSRTGIVYVALDATPAASDARPGMYVAGRIVQRERAGMALPATSLVLRDGFAFVFVVAGEEQRAMQKKVTIGRRQGDDVEILDGVAADDAVIAGGSAFLTDGDRVRVVAAPTPTQRAPS